MPSSLWLATGDGALLPRHEGLPFLARDSLGALSDPLSQPSLPLAAGFPLPASLGVVAVVSAGFREAGLDILRGSPDVPVPSGLTALHDFISRVPQLNLPPIPTIPYYSNPSLSSAGADSSSGAATATGNEGSAAPAFRAFKSLGVHIVRTPPAHCQDPPCTPAHTVRCRGSDLVSEEIRSTVGSRTWRTSVWQ